MGAVPQFDVTIRGIALSDLGLSEWETISGLGLLTGGLIWPCEQIWYGPVLSNGSTIISTSWSLITMAATSWTLCGATVTTSWTLYNTNFLEEC